MCEVLGPSSIATHTDRIVEILLLLLNKKAFCQLKGAGKGAKEDDDKEEDEGF